MRTKSIQDKRIYEKALYDGTVAEHRAIANWMEKYGDSL